MSFPRLVTAALIALGTALTMAACAPSIATPSGFVALDDDELWGDRLYQSVSADGAVILLRVQDNETFGTLEFWQEALSRELTQMRGYELVDAEEVGSAAGSGTWLHLRGGLEEELYRYDVAIFVLEDEVYTIETAAPEALYDTHKAAFASSVRSFSLD